MWMHHFWSNGVTFELFFFRCVDFLQVRTPQGNIISDNCGTDKINLDGVVIPFGEEDRIKMA